MAVIVSIMLPVLTALVLLISRASQRVARFSHFTIVAVLAALFPMSVYKKVQPEFDVLAMFVIGFSGRVFAVLYLRFRTVRLSLMCASPAILVGPLAFLFFSPVFSILSGSSTSRSNPPIGLAGRSMESVVIMVFDELQLFSLLDDKGKVDANRFSNFAELASKATWYRNAATVAESSYKALAAAFSGLYPDPLYSDAIDPRVECL